MKNLYAYFGLLDLHTIDSPGHSLYQLGLIDELRLSHNPNAKFDFFSYYPEHLYENTLVAEFPDSELGNLFSEYFALLIDDYCPKIYEVLERVRNRQYEKLFLKARFRNLSTLSKKWKDTLMFEAIIKTAIESGYSQDEIIILDTDLSLPQSFIEDSHEKYTIITPLGISKEFLMRCVDINMKSTPGDKINASVFYGNIDTSSYKAGNEKNPILLEVLEETVQKLSDLILIAKKDFVYDLGETPNEYNLVSLPRSERSQIWNILACSKIMINVSKDKYDSAHFIPARIYEALIFGMIPVSYRFDWLSSTFSFNDVTDYSEIVKYLTEIDHEDFKKAYLFYINNFIKNVYGSE
jgi:hypothetical protein